MSICGVGRLNDVSWDVCQLFVFEDENCQDSMELDPFGKEIRQLT